MATAQQILGSTQHTLSHTTADGRFALLRGAALAGVFVGKFDRVSTGLGTPHLQDLHPRSAGVGSITPEEHRTALGVTFRTLARPTSAHNRVGNLPQQSDVCDVTFPKNDCCSLSPYNTLACAHSFPFFLFFRGALFCSIRTALATTTTTRTRTFRNFLQNLVSFLPYFYPLLSPNQQISMNPAPLAGCLKTVKYPTPGEIVRPAIDYRSSGDDRVPKRVVVSLPQCALAVDKTERFRCENSFTSNWL